MKFLQRIRSLFGKKTVERHPHTDPLQPDFDIHVWLRQGKELEEENPDLIDGFFPSGPAPLLGFSDHVSPEQDAEQQRRLEEWKQQQEEAGRTQTAATRRAS